MILFCHQLFIVLWNLGTYIWCILLTLGSSKLGREIPCGYLRKFSYQCKFHQAFLEPETLQLANIIPELVFGYPCVGVMAVHETRNLPLTRLAKQTSSDLEWQRSKVTFWYLWHLLLMTSDHSLHLWLGGAIYQDSFHIVVFWKTGVQWFLALMLLCKTIWWKLGVLNERCKPGLAWIWFSITFGSFTSHWMFSRFPWKSQDCHHTVQCHMFRIIWHIT